MTMTTLVDIHVWTNWIALAPCAVIAPDLMFRKNLLYFCKNQQKTTQSTMPCIDVYEMYACMLANKYLFSALKISF